MPEKNKLMNFDEILRKINLDAIEAAILAPKEPGAAPPQYSLDEVQNIKEMILLAGERWLPRDLTELTDVNVELRYDSPEMGLKGFLDLVGTLRGTQKPFDEFAGHKIVIDWKTRTGDLDQRWKDRLVDSWQGRIYAALSGSVLINYRGVSRRGNHTEYPCKDVLLVVPYTNDREVEEYVRGKTAERNALIELGLDVWPRHMPDACNAFGRECPFKGDCDAYSMPRYLPETSKVMSYTSYHNFCLCPERARRLERLLEADGGEEANVGDGFHKGMAALYREAFAHAV